MSQTTLTTFFSSRKRPATDEIVSTKNKIPHIEPNLEANYKIPTSRKLTTISDIDCKQLAAASECKAENEKKSRLFTNLVSKPLAKGEETVSNPTAFTKKSSSNIPKANQCPKPESTAAARKELSLGDIRKKLAGSSRLAELRATADRLSKGIQDLKAKDTSKLKEFKSIDVEIPSSPSKNILSRKELLIPRKETSSTTPQRPFISPRKVVVSPVKSPSKVPAYLRHAFLAAPSTSLPLPHQYRFLAELFRGMEQVVALLYNRNEKITFKKLKPSVQEMLKRNFTEKHLAQIKQLVPDFYNYEVQKNKNFATSAKKESYELIISPNLPNQIKVMNSTVLLERRRYFYDTLLQLVKKHHSQYLKTLDPPMVIADDKLTRWHPEFEIEKVPDVDCAILPEVPNVEKISTAQDVLAKARELFKCNTKMERALEKLAQAKARGLTEQERAVTGIKDDKQTQCSITAQSMPSTSSVTITNPALRNLPAALLEKVKAKQAAKALESMTRSSQHEEKYLIYSRLSDLARTLRNIFVTERKNVLALNVVLSKLDSSFKASVSANDLHRDIKMLAQEVPEWAKLHEIRNTVYLKLDKNADLKKIIVKLDALAAKCKGD